MRSSRWILGLLLLMTGLMQPIHALAVNVGQTDNFEDGTTQNWVVGQLGAVPPFPPTNVPTGGPGGDGDNYLLLTSIFSAFLEPGNRLVVINTTQWTGNFIAAGVNFITMDVKNLGATDLYLRIYVEDPDALPSNTPTHRAVSTDAVFLPAGTGWGRAVFSMNPGRFTALKGNAAAALSNVAELRILHNPTATFPGPSITAQLGVDNITARTILLPPLTDDFDGDGKADYAVFRPSEGMWYVLGSQAGFMAQQWGSEGDIPVPGDYDGDGKTDYAVFRPSEGMWYILGSRSGFMAQQWGTSGDVPIPGDYDRDGKTDYAVWRPGDGYWYILRSSDGVVIQTQWGSAGDIPATQ